MIGGYQFHSKILVRSFPFPFLSSPFSIKLTRTSHPVTELPSTPPTHSRRKDRISYSHQLYTIDLTQVSTPSASQPPQEPTHELEIEFKDAKRLLGEAEKESRGEVNWYLQGVQGMLNNVRKSTHSVALLACKGRGTDERRAY